MRPLAGRPRSTIDLLALQRTAGNAAVGRVLAQRQTLPAPTPKSVDAALKSITLVSSKTNQVTSPWPWLIFRTLPWNPSDGGKKRLYAALKRAHATLRRANAVLGAAVLGAAQQREAASQGTGPKPTTATPAAAAPAVPKRKTKAKHLPTVAEAQAAADNAASVVLARTIELKEYVKGKLTRDTTR